jgi:cytidyltransferase-like protein
MAIHNKIAVVSGGFDPVHSGHIQLFRSAAELFDRKIVVLLNSDEWLTRKKGKPFLPVEERKIILEAMSMVDRVVLFDDSDNSCCDGLEVVKQLYPIDTVVFCNGGDRTKENIPEMQVDGIEFTFGIGGEDKANSSSWILRDAIATRTEERVWGKFADLYTTTGCKVKELVVKPHSGISYQRHFKRSEIWYVRSGEGFVRFAPREAHKSETVKLFKDDIFVVSKGMWHQLYNESHKDLIIIEIQYGTETNEEDIERLEYYGH